MQLQLAAREKVKLRMSISSPTGYGKTYSALLIAFGITENWSKIAVIDSENKSASLYAHLGAYYTIPLEPPFSADRYIQAIEICEKAGIEVIIIDSVTHVWKGEGGLLEYQNSIGGRYQDWAKTTPIYQKWLNKILHSSCHVITTMRKKQAYAMVTENGKSKVEKKGMEDEIRDGFDYEMTIAFDIINDKHLTYTSKDRTGLFSGKPEFVITSATGKIIAEWCDTGVDVKKEVNEAIEKLQNCDTVEELTMFKETLPTFIVCADEFKAAGRKRYEALTATKQTDPAPEPQQRETPEAKKVEGINEVYDKIIAEINQCKSKKDVLNVYSKYKGTVDSDPELQKILKESQSSFSTRKAA